MASTKSSTGQRGWSKENAWGVTGNDICIYFYFILIAIGTLISLEQIIQGHIGSCKDCGSYSKWDGKPWVGEIQIMISHFLKDCTDFLLRIRTTMRYHFTPVRMAAIQKSTSNKCWRGCGEQGILLHCWWECKLVQPLWRTVWRFLKKLEIDLPYDPEIPLLGI